MKTEWNFSELLENGVPQVEKEFSEYEKKVDEFVSNYKEDKSYLNNEKTLKKALEDYDLIDENYSNPNSLIYFWLRSNKNQNDSKVRAKLNKLDDLAKKISNKLIFFDLDLSKINLEKQKQFLNSNILKEYRHFLKREFDAGKYLLSEKEEKLLVLESSVAYSNWKDMLSALISKEERDILINNKTEKKNFSELLSLCDNKDKDIRDSAAEAVNDILEKYSGVAEHEINSILGYKKINDELRNMTRPDLSRYLGDDIEPEIVDVLKESVVENFGISKRYYDLKAKLLNIKKLTYFEKNVPYGSITKEYNFEDSYNLVKTVFANLDKEFADVFERYFSLGRVDVFPKKGKTMGAFCAYFGKSKPIYVLLNHTNKLNDVLTIAHEFGHAINGELSKKQNSLQYDIPTSTAEVASTFMEDFVLQELLKEADEELRLSLMMQKLNSDVATIFRQIACFSFEQELHAQFRLVGYLSKETIGKMFSKYMSDYLGDAVEMAKGSENWWVYWSHIRNYFYNYTYASGLLISKAMQSMVKKDHSSITQIKEFLSAGNRESPKNILLELGIDITKKEFWLLGLKEVEILLNETEKLAKKLGKI